MKIGALLLTLLACAGCTAQDTAPVPEPSAVAFEERSPAGQPLSGVDGVIIKVTARVKKVDLATRKVTLVGPDGEAVTPCGRKDGVLSSS